MTDIKKLLDEAFSPIRPEEEVYHQAPVEYWQGKEEENNRIAPLAKEIIVELVEALRLSQKLAGYEIKYNPPASPGTTLFDIIDKQREALAKVEARLNHSL